MYATLQDVQDRIGERELIALTDRSDPPLGVVDATVVERALADASAQIDAYLAGRYTLPLNNVPAELRRMAVEMGLYHLQSLRPLGDIEDTRKRYEDCLRFLRELSDGKRSLGLSDGSLPAATQAQAGVTMSSADRVFRRDRAVY